MARDLKLQVILDAVDKVTKPLKKITEGSGKTAEALKASKEQLRALEKQQKDVRGYREARAAMRKNTRALSALQGKSETYTQELNEQRERHVNLKANLKTAQRQYDKLTKAVVNATEPSKALTHEFEKARIKLGAQQQAFEKSSRSIKKYREQIRETDQRTGKLTESQRNQQERLDRLKGKLDEAGIGTDNLGRKSRELRKDEERLTDKLEKQRNQLSAVTAQQKRLTAARDRYHKTMGRADSIRGSGMTGLATGGIATAAFTTQAFQNQASGARLAAQMGGTAKDADRYRENVRNVYSGGRGDSMESVERAISAVNSTFNRDGGMTSDQLEAASARALAIQEAFGNEAAENIQIASLMVKNQLAADSEDAFNLLTRAYQRVSVEMRGELPEIIHEYSTNFRALGFDGQEAFNLLVGAADKGRFALDKTGDALKEFTIRGSDMSKASVTAYEAAGLNAQQMSDAIASGGPEAREALQQTARAILAIPEPARRANTAIALFGTPIEDLSVDQIPQFLEALGGTKDMLGQVDDATDAMTRTLDDNARKALSNVQRALSGVFMGVLNNAQDEIIAATKAITGWIKENPELAATLAKIAAALGVVVAVGGSLLILLSSIVGPIAMVNLALGFLAANPVVLTIMAIVAAVAALAGVAYLIYRNWGAISEWFSQRWQDVKAAFSGGLFEIQRLLLNWSPTAILYDAIIGSLGALGISVPEKFQTFGGAIVDGLISGIRGGISALWEMMKSLGTGMASWFADVLGINSPSRVFAEFGAWTVEGLMQGLKDKWTALKNSVTGLASAVTGWFKEKLDINSPSRVFAQLGGYTVDGLNVGLDRQRDEPVKRIADIAKRVSQAGAGIALGAATLPAAAMPGIDTGEPIRFDTRPPIGAPASSGGYADHSTRNYNITINAQPGSDERSIARAVAEEIDRRERMRAARGRSSMWDQE